MIKTLRLRDLREDHFWTQEQVAQKLKIVRRTYCEYELQNSMIPIEILCQLAMLYKVSIQYLCGLTSTKKPYGEFLEYDKKIFLTNLKELREKNKYSQVELSKKISCDQSAISHYEKGKRNMPISILISISNLYQVPIDEIIGIIKK